MLVPRISSRHRSSRENARYKHGGDLPSGLLYASHSGRYYTPYVADDGIRSTVVVGGALA